MQGSRTFASAISVVSALAAGAANAHQTNHRLPPVTIFWQAETKPATSDASTATTRSLSRRDQFSLVAGRTRQSRFDAGPILFTITGSKLRTASQTDRSELRNRDRMSVLAIGMDAGIEVTDTITFHAFSQSMRAKRRIDLLPGSSRSLKSGMTVIGVGLEHDALGSVKLDYTSNAMRGRHDALSRITEQLGGAAPFGKGLRLALSTASGAEVPGRVSWTVSAAAIERPAYIGTLAPTTQRLADNRAEIAFRIAL